MAPMSTHNQTSDLITHLGYWLRLVSNHVSQAFARKVGDAGVTVAEWVFLRALISREDVSPSPLAETPGITRGAISKLSDRLLAKKLLTCIAHEQVGRAHTLALTRKGRELCLCSRHWPMPMMRSSSPTSARASARCSSY
jgi:DNA-binding MarR family transcriptional regulator